MSVTIRMKRMGRKNRAFYRICASDKRSPRDGRVIEELGTYDPFVPETDARCVLSMDLGCSIGCPLVPSPVMQFACSSRNMDQAAHTKRQWN